LIGRVVPIKDVKTFIRGIFMASRTMPDIEGWIVGPEEEDPDYAEECRALAQSLGLARNVRFFGFQRVSEMLPRIDLVVLTSISEALPLVVLEGFAAGVPAITTDVGSCRQLIEGGGEADRALGSAGMIVPIANPAAFAQAALTLLGDDARWRAAQRAGLARVRQFYGKQTMIDRYRSLYTRLSQAPGREGGTVDGGDAHRRAFERCPVHDGSAMAANPNPARHTGGGR
jgi:glycosyltransferase involved in cell wall biosynthesis